MYGKQKLGIVQWRFCGQFLKQVEIRPLYNLIQEFRKMKSSIDTLLQQQLQFKTGVAYLVPTKWWDQFRQINAHAKSKDELAFPTLSLQRHVDTFLLEFEEGIIAELEHKSNYLKFNKTIVCPQTKKNVEWTLVSPAIWKLVSSKSKPRFCLITLYYEHDPTSVLTGNDIQVQIIFCSKAKSDAYVGFLPDNTDAVHAIRTIGYELGFVEMNNSRIIFPDKNPDQPHFYCELETITLAESQDTLFLAYNLECIEPKDDKNDALNFSFGKGDEMANSNEAMAGDVGAIGIESFEQVRNDGTISTGAETPSFFGSEEDNMREFRVRELFRQKKPQQIQQLRTKAKHIVKSSLIPVTEHSEKQINQQLQTIVQDLYEHINMHKKKSHKDKQYQHQ